MEEEAVTVKKRPQQQWQKEVGGSGDVGAGGQKKKKQVLCVSSQFNLNFSTPSPSTKCVLPRSLSHLQTSEWRWTEGGRLSK